jgi:hypothetical protein
VNDCVDACATAVGDEAFEFVAGLSIECGWEVGDEEVAIGFYNGLAIGVVVFEGFVVAA